MSVSSSSSRAPSRGSGPGAMKQKPNTANNAEGNISVSPDGDDEFDDHRRLSQSGTRWTRFFPELSSHFSLVSPVSSRHQSTSSYGTIAISQYSRHSRQSSHDLGDISEPKTGSSSQCSTELVDDASSCYSRRSSVTSLGSEFSPSAYKSADAYSIISPAMAGVFDDSESLYRSGSTRSRASRRSRKSIKRTPSARNKPLPCPPPIQMKPLSIRHKHRYPRQHEPTICEDTLDEGCESSLTVNLRPQSQLHKQRRHHPTLSQAAEDLEDALAGLVERNYKEETGIYSPYVSSPVAATATTSMPRLDSPLQVSRGNMDMIATRPAPSPPTGHRKSGSSGSSGSSSSKKSLKKGLLPAQTEETMKHAKKPHKDKGRGPFSFNMSLPSFGALKAKTVKNRDDGHFRSHRRSMSGSGLLQRAARQEVRPSTASTPEEAENKNEAVGSAQLLSVPVRAQRSASVSSERELRLKLPRLQTKEVQPSGMLCQAQPSTKSAINISAADEALQEKEIVPQPQSRRRSNTLSLNSQGTMPNNQPTGTGTSVPIGQYEMPTSTTTFNSNAEPVYELDAGLPEQQIKSPVAPSPFVPSGQMPGILPDEIVELILRRCNQLQDLFNFAVMNRQFYRVFKQRELDLIQNTVYAMSPPAWELREMSPPWDSEWQVLFDLDAPVPEYTQSLYLDRYTRDLYTLVKLKSLILARCSTFLRPETIRGLAGQDDTRAAEIDDAFWRVWTFCRIFGCGKGREGDIVGQLDWLNGGIMAKNQQRSMAMSISEPFGINDVLFQPPEGFGLGNKGGLSQGQLYDMTEIWTCLGVLLQPIHSKCEEARKAGVFDGHDVANKDSVKEEATLEEWTSYVLTLGPSAVLALASIATVDNADEIFQRAQSLGLTKWEEADASRSSFFRDAVSKAYRPQTSARRLHPLHQTGSNSSRSSAESNSSPSDNLLTSDPQRRRQAAYAVQLRNRRNQNGDRPNPGVEERPISSYVEIMNRLAGAPPHPLYQQIPPLPTSTPTPEYNPSPQPRAASPPQHRVPTAGTPNTQVPQARAPRAAVSLLQPQVLDPTDQAMDMIVNELGFSAEDAKWALKITDTGEGINVNAAVSLLIQEYNRPSLVPSARSSADASSYGHVYSPPLSVYQGQHCNSILSSVMQRPDAAASGWRWA